MKKIIALVLLIMMILPGTLMASDHDIQKQHYCSMSSLEIFVQWYDYCYYVDDLGESYLCEISALDVLADYYYICWLD